MRPIRALLFAVLAALFAAPADAAPLRFDLSSTCVANCSVIGLMDGDPVGGFLILESTALVGLSGGGRYDSSVEPSTIIDFMMTFGDITVTAAESASSFFVAATGDPTMVSSFSFKASEYTATSLGEGFEISQRRGVVGAQTSCRVRTGCTTTTLFVDGPFAELGPFSSSSGFTPPPVQPSAVPLPATAFLLLGGLGLMAAARRKT